MFSDEQKENIGNYLRMLITKPDENGEEIPQTRFYERYLEALGIEINEDEIKRIRTRFSAILNGRNNLNIANDDIVIISRLLGVSIEEIISAGKRRYNTPESCVKNYDIAASSDKSIWEKCITSDNESLVRRDEYGKTILDYAVDFRNYSLIKYMLEIKFFWFTSVPSDENKIRIMEFDSGTILGDYDDLKNKMYHNDSFRKATVIMALENEDHEILPSLRARETLELLGLAEYGAEWDKSSCTDKNFADEMNKDIVDAIVHAQNEKIIEYFSEEFEVTTYTRRRSSEKKFIYPYISQIIEGLICNDRDQQAEMVLCSAIAHNRTAFEKVSERIEMRIAADYETEEKVLSETVDEMRKNGISEEQIEIIKTKRLNKGRMKQDVLDHELKFDSERLVISFNHFHSHGLVTNITRLNTNKITNVSKKIQKLVDELNTWYRKTIELGGEKYAEVLHEL